MRLLLAEDERELSRALTAILTHHNYSVDPVYDGADALDYALTGAYDGIIMDIMMPKLDGVEVLRRLREANIAVPVLLLTAKSGVEDRISGLDAGADDYLPKPFDTGELLARLRAMLRRREGFSPELIRFSDLSLDRGSYTLHGPIGEVRLANKEFQLMEYFMDNPRQVLATSQLMERVWGWDSDAELSVVWVYVSNLRKKIKSIGARAELRATRGVGYSLEEQA
ncbi:MAG: response regulator transcription factor [Clostridiaceae bacterium]|nr:response regulator transcription factor [Clostridiaceae bacterium]